MHAVGPAERLPRMRIAVLAGVALFAAALAAAQAGAARPATVLEIEHYYRGCHVFVVNEKPTVSLRLRKGDRIKLIDHDVMDFDFAQTAGPRVPFGDPRLRRSETRTLVFRKSGVYRFAGKNVESSEEMGMQTLGPDNTLRITIRVP
jgi:hypothetical protein